MAKVTVTYKLSNKKFINPYNFVSIDTSKKSQPSKAKGELLSGVIKCSIITRTPLAIPNVAESKNKKEEHSKYSCMKNSAGQPIIPGSSLRGAIRSVYEAATNSCLSTVDDDSFITARTGMKTKTYPGVLMLENGVWHLYEASSFRLKIGEDKFKDKYEIGVDDGGKYIKANGKKIYSGTKVHYTQYRVTERRKEKGKFEDKKILYTKLAEVGSEGILVLGEQFSSKRSEKIFVIQETLDIDSDILKKAIDGLEKTLEIYRDKAINKNYKSNDEDRHEGYPTYERMKKNGCIPVWYAQKNGNYYLSLAGKGRVAYNSTIAKMLDKLTPCKNSEEMCKVCNLFGMIGDNYAKSSRIRFTDAVCISDVPYMGYYTLQELSSPKTSYTPFYADIDKYDAKHPVDYDDGIKIRGRKFYWHSTDYMSHICEKDSGEIEETPRNSTIELVAENKQFTFYIYLDKIDAMQLNELVWTLTFGENNSNGLLCHKLGHGKPLGLGSAKITVDSINARSFDGTNYTINPYDLENISKPDFVTMNKSVNELLQIAKFSEREVSYPYVDSNGFYEAEEKHKAAYNWFSENKSGRLDGRDWDVQLLPKINDDCDSSKLKVIKISKVTIGNRQYNNGSRKINNWNGKKNQKRHW